jgi:hypothetical protein
MNRRWTWCAGVALGARLVAAPGVALAQDPTPNADEPNKAPAAAVETTTPAAAPSPTSAPPATPEAPRDVSAPVVPEASPYSAPSDAADLGKPQALTLYGFLDFGVNKFYTSDRSQLNALFPSRAGTFVLGNVNLFFDAEPYQDWRSLIEVRFTNLPHGYERTLASPLGDQYERADTRVEDFTSPSIRGEATLGSVIIERAQTEYAFSDAFKIMGGYFFTPFGIWNVDHGTPTLISLLLPSFMADSRIPIRQLGVEAHGSFYTSDWELGYSVYVGNGRTPSQVDFTEDKTVGGRLFASSTGTAVKAKFGVSGYRAPHSDMRKEVVSLLPYLVETQQTVAGTEWAAGADVSVDAGPFRLRTEGLVRRIDFEPGKRDGRTPNHYFTNGYVIAAYQLPWAGLEPYVYVEGMHWPSVVGDTAVVPSVGLNVHFNPAVQLKTQYGRAFFFDTSLKENRNPSDNNVQNVSARLVVSF